MTQEERDAAIVKLMPIAGAVAREFSYKDEEQYEEMRAQALLILTEEVNSFDPVKCHLREAGLPGIMKQRVRWRMIDQYKKKKRRDADGSIESLIDGDPAKGTIANALVDPRQDDPAQVVEVREKYTPKRRSVISEVKVRTSDPETGKWAAHLRKACFDAISPQDMTDVMKTVVKRAKDGDIQAVKLLLDYFAGGLKGGVTSQVVVQDEE